jgi:DNA-binding LytR/AlgR family response regulator
MNIPCIIVDDEPLAREGLERLVRETGFLDLVAQCSNAIEANRILATEKVELMFLDIQMPRLLGTDFLRSLEVKPKVIITSAYTDFAIEGFELNVLDYLLKPITQERFLKAVNRAREAISTQARETQSTQARDARSTHASEPQSPPTQAPPSTPTYELRSAPAREALPPEETHFFVRAGNSFEKIVFDELLFIEAAQNYCALHTIHGKILTLSTIHALEEQLPAHQFLRVQKSYIVAINKIRSVSAVDVVIGPHHIPVSKNYRDALLALVDKRLLRK